MSRFLLDTNIISDATKAVPSNSLLDWLSRQRDGDLFIASMSIAEIWRRILQMPAGNKRDALQTWFSSAGGPLAFFKGRILAFDEAAALIWAGLMSEGKAAGRPRNDLDMIIASVAIAGDCIVVTNNERDFAGLEVLNPMRGSAR